MNRFVIASVVGIALVVGAVGVSDSAFAAPPKKSDAKKADVRKKKAPTAKVAPKAKKPTQTPAPAETTADVETPDQKPVAAEPSEKGSSSSLAKAMGGGSDSKAPVFITSDSLKLDARERVFTYYDNVKIVKADTTITADKVTGRYDAQNQIERAVCEKNVVIVRGDTIRATSNRADYDVKKGVIVMTEGPELNDRGNVLNADRVTIYVNEDRSEADGHVRVKVLKTDQQVTAAGAK